MEENKDLDKIIKSSFDKIGQGAPDSLWVKLSAAMDTDDASPQEKIIQQDELNEKVRESFNSIDKKAPWKVWPAINRQLNIEKAWQGISSELDKTPFYWPVKRMAAAFLLLLLSGAGSYYLFIHSSSSPQLRLEEASIAQELSTTDNAIEKGYPLTDLDSLKSIRFVPETSGIPGVQHPYSALLATSGPGLKTAPQLHTPLLTREEKELKAPTATPDNSISPEVKVNRNASNNNGSTHRDPGSGMDHFNTAFSPADNGPTASLIASNELAGSGAEPMIFFDVRGRSFIYEEINSNITINFTLLDTIALEEQLFASPMEKEIPEERIKNTFGFPAFNAGPVMTYNSSWLLNNETRSSYDKNSLISSDPTYKENWGLALNYQLSERNVIATEVYMLSKAGQQYKMYQEGEYLEKGLELRYYKLYLQYQRNFLYYGAQNPSWLTAKAGAYGGFLQKKVGEIRQEENRYSNLDYGLKMAVGQENSFGNFILGYGISAERGLNNVFKGSEKLPAEFNKTYTLNIGTYLNLRYVF